MKIEGETRKMSRGMKREDGKLQTRQATRQGTSGQGTSSQATSPTVAGHAKDASKRPRTNYRAQQSINNRESTREYQQQRINRDTDQERLLSAREPCAEHQERWSRNTRGRETRRLRRTPRLPLASGVGLVGAEALCGMVRVAPVPWNLDPRPPLGVNAQQWIGRKPPAAPAAAVAAELCDQIHQGCVSGDGRAAEHRPQACYRSRNTGLADSCD
jgi:hypothetical protein